MYTIVIKVYTFFCLCGIIENIGGKTMDIELLNNDNISDAIKMQKDLFPLENGSEDLKEALNNVCPPHQFFQRYWLVKVGVKYVGIFGFYAYKHSPKDAWLGWYGVVEDERKKGYGKQILLEAMKIARDLGFDTLRLFTDEEDNDKAVLLYKKLEMLEEEYVNPADCHYEVGRTLIFSKSLTDKITKPWNNKNLYLHP